MKTKFIYGVLVSILLVFSCTNDSDLIDGINADSATELKGGKEKVAVCHYNAKKDTWKTISVPEKQLARHLNHGDFLGACETDSDGDGVPDYLDQCPDTPVNAQVDDQGCEKIQRPFIFTIMYNYDPSYPSSITIPTDPTLQYNFTVDWGDGNIDENITGDITHNYNSDAERLPIKITGTFPRLYFFTGNQVRFYQYTILQWGDIEWSTMENALSLEGVHMLATDSPDLSNCTSLKNMFANTYGFINSSIGNWDVSTIIDMSGMLKARGYGAPDASGPTGPVDLSEWVVSNVTNMSEMFAGGLVGIGLTPDFIPGYSRTTGISSWDVSKVTNMAGMFRGSVFNEDISSWDVSNVTNMSEMFRFSNFNQDISSWDVINVSNMVGMFSNQDLNTNGYFFPSMNFNQDLSTWNVDNVIQCENFSYETPQWTLPKPTFTNCTE